MTTKTSLPIAQSPRSHEALLAPNEHVLSTLEQDGSRRWLRPKLSTGQWWRRRRVIAYLLMVVFVAVPHIRISGKPLILIDIPAREFTVFGMTFLPTDTLLLALLILSVFISIVLITAITGRAWCGWACPQTVYMEFLFRPIDRLFEGTRGKGGNPKAAMSGLRQVARLVVYLLLCMFLAHTFLAYFVGTERLSLWMRSSPVQHPMAFLVMAGTDQFDVVRLPFLSRTNVSDRLSLRTLSVGDAGRAIEDRGLRSGSRRTAHERETTA
ncbi:MAG: 4Fe-4S binding protein [Pirellulaceae bacterium]